MTQSVIIMFLSYFPLQSNEHTLNSIKLFFLHKVITSATMQCLHTPQQITKTILVSLTSD